MGPHRWLVAAVLCVCLQLASAGDKTLVLLDDHSLAYTHSIFFNSLRDRGFDLEFATADNSGLALSKYGEYIYQHLVIFSPSVTEFGGKLNVRTILKFIDDGGNVLVAANPSIDEPLRKLGSECGIEFDETKTSVIDHVNHDTADQGKHSRIVVDPDNVIKNVPIAGKPLSAPLLFSGVGLVVDPDNSLVTTIVHGSGSTYSYYQDEKITVYPHAVGRKTGLVAAVQARNNARVVFAGSLDMFSDKFLTASVESARPGSQRFEKSGNEDFVRALSAWTFHHSGVLRYTNVKHHIVGESTPPQFYTIEDDVIFSLHIEEKVDGVWQPFAGKDVQMEFHRIDPFVRLPLVPSNGDFSVRFTLPDVYGVFRFQVDYRSLGYTFLYSASQVPVRPKTHVQYERFIVSAFPYYAGAFSMMIGLILFSSVFLFHNAPSEKSKTE
ncbi:dolichyl-diphosphooligosaccharide--protein glycosyltransferase 48 kDa subunit-like [Sycon ciliatum]|uniref:dolichyl-diphosphooligosaccharide--protein glycosyltransferase 48 kDa subunit-like n=1 Tax=Sycon ciliatum TaxID=27933 RepID=UPI0020ACDE5D|eukprot:scpid78653/ scgid33813/ Dolichyl-diphosphooligosaccharide--protein glycosyltransferase 48 kDa subunit